MSGNYPRWQDIATGVPPLPDPPARKPRTRKSLLADIEKLIAWKTGRSETADYCPDDVDDVLRILRGELPSIGPLWREAVRLGFEPPPWSGEPRSVPEFVQALHDLAESLHDKRRDPDEWDERDYMPANACRNHRISNHKKLKTLLDDVPNDPYPAGMRRRYKGQHLYVHAEDWRHRNDDEDRREREAADHVERGVEARMAEVLAEKNSKKPRRK